MCWLRLAHLSDAFNVVHGFEFRQFNVPFEQAVTMFPGSSNHLVAFVISSATKHSF